MTARAMKPLIAATAIVLLSTYGAFAETPVPTPRPIPHEVGPDGPPSYTDIYPEARGAALRHVGAGDIPAYGTREYVEFYRHFWKNAGGGGGGPAWVLMSR